MTSDAMRVWATEVEQGFNSMLVGEPYNFMHPKNSPYNCAAGNTEASKYIPLFH
jgi:hypothetical protein